jgi:hypothetical protein
MTHLTRDLYGLTVNQAKTVIADLIRYPNKVLFGNNQADEKSSGSRF